MKTSLIYFDNNEYSKKGLLRGLIMMPTVMISVIIIIMVLHTTFKKFKLKNILNKKLFILSFLISVIIVSTIGVQDDNNTNHVLAYNGLVFFVIYGVLVLHVVYFHKKIKYAPLAFALVLSVGLGVLNGYISHKIAPNFP